MDADKLRFMKVRFAAALFVFLCWIGFLAYLVARTRQPVLVSTPQFLVSNLIAFVQLTGDEKPDEDAVISAVEWSNEPKDAGLVGKKINIQKLSATSADTGWKGPGLYLIPLLKLDNGVLHIAPIPPNPGFNVAGRLDLWRIYRDTPDVRAQLRDILAAKEKPR